MTLHLIKLCVGCESVESLAGFQARRIARGDPNVHVTRMVPRRAGKIVDGGSLFWVIKKVVRVRQRITAIEPFVDSEGTRRCALVLDPELVPTEPRPWRAFQGWRYLEPKDAPPDERERPEGVDDMPPEMVAELKALGLI